MLTEAAIWKGVESLKRYFTFFMTSFLYTDPNEEITSSSRSLKSDSLNNEESNMSASKEVGDADFFTDIGGSGEATAFTFPFVLVGTPLGGGGGGGGVATRHFQQFLSLLEIGRKDIAPRPVNWRIEGPWGLKQPPLVGEWKLSPLLTHPHPLLATGVPATPQQSPAITFND